MANEHKIKKPKKNSGLTEQNLLHLVFEKLTGK